MQHTYLKIYLWKIFRMPCSSCMHEEENAIGPVTFDVMYITKKKCSFGGRELILISSYHKTDEYGKCFYQSLFYTTVRSGEDSHHCVQ